MEFLNKILSQPRRALWLVAALATINLVVFASLFGFHENNDTDSYIIAINYFRGDPSAELFPNRYLNPFYSIVSATALRFLSPVASIIVLNIIFYFGLVFLTYGLIRRVFNNPRVALFSATIIMGAYPMVRYGLTQVQDLGGYFWFVLCLYSGWRWYEDKKISWLLLGSIAISGGLLTKESGAMGALFFGTLILLNRSTWRAKFVHLSTLGSIALVTLLINMYRGHLINYSSLQWFLDNWKVYAPTNYVAIKWLGVNLTTYNLLWPLVLGGIYLLWKNWKEKNAVSENTKIYFLAVFVPSLSYFAWPLFIGRTVFISAWLVVPLAAFALEYLAERKALLGYVVWALVLITPYALQSTLRYVHVFQIWDMCHHQIRCSWDYFWANRHSFSTTL